jgi:hypothetical protein
MTLEAAIRWIGLSHLLQPLLTPALSRMLGFAEAFSALPPIPRQIAHNMAVASVALPTSLGVLVAYYAGDIIAAGPSQSVAWVAVAFWSWRLRRQCALARLWPTTSPSARWCHWMLIVTFVVQGPVLGALLALGRPAQVVPPARTATSFNDPAHHHVSNDPLRSAAPAE